jgi:hypothetical protein
VILVLLNWPSAIDRMFRVLTICRTAKLAAVLAGFVQVFLLCGLSFVLPTTRNSWRRNDFNCKSFPAAPARLLSIPSLFAENAGLPNHCLEEASGSRSRRERPTRKGGCIDRVAQESGAHPCAPQPVVVSPHCALAENRIFDRPLLAQSGPSPAKLFIATIRFRASLSEINIKADRRS